MIEAITRPEVNTESSAEKSDALVKATAPDREHQDSSFLTKIVCTFFLFTALVGLCYSEAIASRLAVFVGLNLFAPEPVLSSPENPGAKLFNTSDFLLLLDQRRLESVAGTAWFNGALTVVVLVFCFVGFHALLWTSMKRKERQFIFKGIDYIWYTGAVIALLLALVDLALPGTTELQRQYSMYTELSSDSMRMANSALESCESDPGKWVSHPTLGNRCEALIELLAFVYNKKALIEYGVLYDGLNLGVQQNNATSRWRLYDYDKLLVYTKKSIWLGDIRFSTLFSISSEEIECFANADCVPNEQLLMSCERLEQWKLNNRVSSPQLSLPVSPPAETGFYDVEFLCARVAYLRQAAAELERGVRNQILLELGGGFRNNWLLVLAVVIGLRMTKTTSEFREAWKNKR